MIPPGENHGTFRPSAAVLTSMMGLEANTFSSMLASLAEPLTVAKYLMAYLAETVFPAPDSPLTMIDWFLSSLVERRGKAKEKMDHLATTPNQQQDLQTAGGDF